MGTKTLIKLGALEPKQTAFLLCDIQEIFRKHVKHFGEIVKVANKMMQASKSFCIPVYVSEQYPKGLGHTAEDVNVADATWLYEKTKFSMLTPELHVRMQTDVPQLSSVVLCGLETHVCIEQTAIDLMSEGLEVHVLADGVSSRSNMDRGLALQRLQALGCFVTTSENVLFKLLKDKNHPSFKFISKLNKTPTVDTLGYDLKNKA
ncbi:isochorismatase domain-containing protein 1-like [Pectinophora gossypiella]|uniref:isochorismatase domain-containing protein 1-like n=1 Tax=Pectinophora gossypiella TaxID=13191 RepID=UPI00214F0763|nr:isochorismatase domain-containing protein 1-like [Pectinophora gossypiella]